MVPEIFSIVLAAMDLMVMQSTAVFLSRKSAFVFSFLNLSETSRFILHYSSIRGSSLSSC